MEDVVEQLEPLRADALADLDAPGGVVAHVILVAALAVEQFQDDGDLVLLGDRHEPLQALDAVLQALPRRSCRCGCRRR